MGTKIKNGKAVTQTVSKKNALTGDARSQHQTAYFTAKSAGVINPRTKEIIPDKTVAKLSTETKSGISQLGYASTIAAREYRDMKLQQEGKIADSFVNKVYNKDKVEYVVKNSTPTRPQNHIAEENLRAITKSLVEKGFTGEIPTISDIEADVFKSQGYETRSSYVEDGIVKPKVEYRESQGGYGFTAPDGTWGTSPVQSGDIRDVTAAAEEANASIQTLKWAKYALIGIGLLGTGYLLTRAAR